MELSHQRLLRSALHAQRRHEGLQAAFPGMPIRNPNWAIMLACFTALLKGQAQCVKQIRSILDESHTAVLRHIDTLEAHGLIGRQRDRADGRRTQVLLTQRGAAATADYLGSFGDPADDGDPAETASREPAFSAT